MTDFQNGDFLWLVTDGQMMAYTGESEVNLEASLAGTAVVQASTEENTVGTGPKGG